MATLRKDEDEDEDEENGDNHTRSLDASIVPLVIMVARCGATEDLPQCGDTLRQILQKLRRAAN
jgi:hypothetical protein